MITKKNSIKIWGVLIALLLISLTACGKDRDFSADSYDDDTSVEIIPVNSVKDEGNLKSESEEPQLEEKVPADDEPATTNQETSDQEAMDQGSIEYNGVLYQIIQVDGGDLSGERQSNVAVDVGYGARIYWAFTNEYGQLVNVVADQVVLQDNAELTEGNSRYYPDEAKVPGTEREDLDEGHIIADSLGGVANAYNITPQNSVLNRHGDQAYMEKVIRDAGGCEDFVATITYPDTVTQIPSHYKFEYILKGYQVVDEFDNVNPDEVNAAINAQTDIADENITEPPAAIPEVAAAEADSIAGIDTNGNGQVTIAEAKAAGFTMPIHADHWLYKYMHDGDGDGMVGE